MRILEYFFPDRELNLQTLRCIAKDIVNGTLTMPTPQQTPPSQEPISNDDEESPQEAEPVVESVNDLHEPLGSFMKDSQGRFRKYPQTHNRIQLTIKVTSARILKFRSTQPSAPSAKKNEETRVSSVRRR
jgi:aldehyde dehydrogenase (NAD+)